MYVNSSGEQLPGVEGKIVFDRFHIAEQWGRGGGPSAAGGQDAVSREKDRLAGTRCDWLRHPAAPTAWPRRARVFRGGRVRQLAGVANLLEGHLRLRLKLEPARSDRGAPLLGQRRAWFHADKNEALLVC